MPNNWKTYKLEDISTKLGDGLHGTPKYKADGEYYFINGSNLLNGEIIFKESTKKVDQAQFDKYKKELTERTILVSINGTIGNIAFYNGEKVVLGKSACYFNIIADVDKFFIKHLLSSYLFQDYINTNYTGSVIKNVSLKTMREFRISLPPLPEQRAIASILSTIDDQIENNLAMNKTLEEMAMALYKHWFVDFGPFQEGNFVESELGEIPEGWEVKSLKDFAVVTMGQSPKSEFYNDEKKGLPFHQGVKDYSERFPTDITYSTEGKRYAIENDIIFSVRAPVGRINVAKNKIILGRGVAGISNKENFSFLLYMLKYMFHKEDIIGSGTVYNSVNRKELENLKFVIPDDETLNKFRRKVSQLDEKYLNNYKENQTLIELRDALLPKLVSGEVRVKMN